MYDSIVITCFFACYLLERTYYYCVYKKNKQGLLNLNTPLSQSDVAVYNKVEIKEKTPVKDSIL